MIGACVLVVDAEDVTRRAICSCFDTDGFRVLEAGEPANARSLLASDSPDLVLLDLDSAEEDGLALARQVCRDHQHAAIIAVSARTDRLLRISALDEFADDYIAKPIDMRELLARSHAVLRRVSRARTREARNGAVVHAPSRPVTVAGFTLDLQSHRVTAPCGSRVELTASEFRLLEALIANPNRVLSRERLLELSGGGNGAGGTASYDRAIDMRVRRLREKLGQYEPAASELIKTVRGFGYMFLAS